ncbi:DUF2075 domain-containing protein [Thalassoglobus polymorphus]|uniref:Schlafen group 3-like DNA/RNA helicase domain-containing protein n=1 Tax=Thalassoglobus polymorphus TaxID=2527994 RepID=A0A517QQK8_9PLAN|nr:DUF2075 domain-containing protein [Thalassoglobus polymorphus]QDT33930.1 hypothetical protein Mal48_31870 [Thalassoglobus polymorphus]
MTRYPLTRYFYGDNISEFLSKSVEEIIGTLSLKNTFELDVSQRDAWVQEICILKDVLVSIAAEGRIYLEYSIPRLGRRIDVVLVIANVVFVLEFKVGETAFNSAAIDQVWDYALDLKNFHETSHDRIIAPVLVATAATTGADKRFARLHDDVYNPILSNSNNLLHVITSVLAETCGENRCVDDWEKGRYSPTPTIIEAAQALYSGHLVEEITRNDASATNLTLTTNAIENVIHSAKREKQKYICFVTGVPGAGKTLVGLDIATSHTNKAEDLHSVFLSGNGPLVAVLREALARDKVHREKEMGRKAKKSEALSEVKMFIQNVHHFRDECLVDSDRPPIEHVAIFDEAQRAWNLDQTTKFMMQKKNFKDFVQSEPEFLISCLDRHEDWAVVICLVGGGQEINTGEAGIQEWISAVSKSFPNWNLLLSSRLTDKEYGSGSVIDEVKKRGRSEFIDQLHLNVSMRSYRAEKVSLLVKELLDCDLSKAQKTLLSINDKYPIVITRDINVAKEWIRGKARGSERYGVVASSQAQRLKPHAIDVRIQIDPIHWFLNPKEDVRSSFYLEDAATEFKVQGLELDWTLVTWDADFRKTTDYWGHFSFRGDRWTHIRKDERKTYLKNAYRVLLTRARQGMVIYVPNGDSNDPTRDSTFYDTTFDYLKSIGFSVIE